MFWRKSILAKILLGIICPMIAILFIIGNLLLGYVEESIASGASSELEARSEAASSNVSEFFTRYMEIVHQASQNYQLVKLMEETPAGAKAAEAYSFADVVKTLETVIEGESNVELIFTVDVDSGESVRPGGDVKGLPDYVVSERPWFKALIEKKALFIEEPYVSATTGSTVATIMAPVFSEANLIGGMAINLTVNKLSEMMAAYKLGENGFFILLSADGMLVYHPVEESRGINIADSEMSENIISAVQNKQAGGYVYTNNGIECNGYLSTVGDTGWMVLTGLPQEELYAPYYQIRENLIFITGAGILILTALTMLVSIGIVRPLKQLSKAANQIADGRLDVTINVKSKDEASRVASAMSRTVERLKHYIEYIDEISGILNQIAQGDIDFELTRSYEGEFAKIKDGLLNIRTALSVVFSNINGSANEVRKGTGQISSSAQILAQNSTEQSVSVEGLASSINNISEQVNMSAENSHNANTVANQVAQEIELSNQQMKEMIEAMSEIRSSSNEIGQIIKTVEDIAFQTNILALNAAVEAARAGTAGKGFAVVADEVRNLAGKSAVAAENTSSLIERSLETVEKGARIVKGTADSLHGVVTRAKQMSEIVDTISSASKQQANSISQITLRIDEISKVVQTNALTSEQIASVSSEMEGQSQVLHQMVDMFKYQDTGLALPASDRQYAD